MGKEMGALPRLRAIRFRRVRHSFPFIHFSAISFFFLKPKRENTIFVK
jgi:hypothetical protein